MDRLKDGVESKSSNLDDPDYIPDLSKDYDVNHTLSPITESTEDSSSYQNDSSSSIVAIPLQQLQTDRINEPHMWEIILDSSDTEILNLCRFPVLPAVFAEVLMIMNLLDLQGAAAAAIHQIYFSIKVNIPFMKKLILDTTLGSKIKFDQQRLIIDENFLNLVRAEIRLMDPIYEAIKVCQQANISITDGAAKWLELNLKENVTESMQDKLTLCNIYSLTAYYLHPLYHQRSKEKLKEDLMIIQEFLIEALDSTGITSLSILEASEEIFEKLQLKDVKDLISYAHCPMQNRLTFERSKKLLHVYYTLKLEDDIDLNVDFDDENE
ncbi:hypothetical protein PGB90_002703 [Kerria lacca]